MGWPIVYTALNGVSFAFPDHFHRRPRPAVSIWSHRLRIVFVTGSLVHGGAERHTITLMNRLAERGHECHAVYVKNDSSQLARIRLQGLGSARCLHAARYFDPRAIATLAQHLTELKPSVVVAVNSYALMYAKLALWRSDVKSPLIVTHHTTRLVSTKEFLQSLLYRFFFRSANCTVFVCNNQMRYWRRRILGSGRNEVIYNGVDTDHFSDRSNETENLRLRQQFGILPDDFVIGISAVLRPEKNHVQLMEAVAQLRAIGIPALALIIGDGATRGAVEAKACELNIANAIRITGFQQDVRPFMAVCDVLVLCSLSETFSLAALEAMALAKPMVHANIGGAAEMIFPGINGYLFRAGDTVTFVASLASLADRNIASRMGLVARAVVETMFSEKHMIDQYEQLLVKIYQTSRA
jgi:glycosyltransferase involved in cell wall biosynthesis